ncbi:hypothetical protein DAPPUDRAFT_239844 [Daphnia pulex]|uniref:Uncharacterized protein n=1 Tax=Daphnia pulex TaxID=6669 RepID=E9GA74_DAPPU|nr:hypothetical protein DAPPUDRAFT_239844 [Daphnia pulex]|eukprot:EFX83693.1 hypothetical protein DAPPUDRAFT_239844 [Daphnia pulex]
MGLTLVIIAKTGTKSEDVESERERRFYQDLNDLTEGQRTQHRISRSSIKSLPVKSRVLSNLVGESIHLETIPECQIKMLMDVHEAGHVVYVENRIRTNPFEDQENME